MTEVTRILAKWVVDSKLDRIPAEVRKSGAASFLNWMGCAVGGSRHETLDRAIAALEAFPDARLIVAGIAEAYTPEQMVGRTIAIVFNLKPAKLMGIESNGMVLAASVEGGLPTLVGFERDVPPGARVR